MRSQHNFSQTPSVSIPRSTFNLSHGRKTAFDADDLVPIAKPIDIIPGDTFRCSTSFFMRLATPLAPILDNLYFESFAFFVPYRLLWDAHEKFHGAQDKPGDSISFTIPLLSRADAALTTLGSQWDHFGLPPLAIPDDVPVSVLPFRAYIKIYNDWFRSATLQDSIAMSIGNGPDAQATAGVGGLLFKRGKRFDYLTSALPAPQRGTAVALPIAGRGLVKALETGGNDLLFQGQTAGFVDTDTMNMDASGATLTVGADDVTGSTMYVEFSEALNMDVNDVRLAFATQHVLERDARSGTRYVESLKARWGVVSPDFRLDRAEFLGSGSTRVNVTPVQQTSAIKTTDTPLFDDILGAQGAYGTASGTHSWSKSFVEHGVVIILGNLRGDITYSQGVDRYWSKTTRYDFMYPELANIGEQGILNSEIWITGTGTAAVDDLVFGYTGRYDEYRFISSDLCNIMRPATSGGVDTTGTLASWHLSEDFATLPALGNTFIKANTSVPLDRAIAIASEPHMIADFYHSIKAARPLPTFGVPGLTRL